MLLNQFRTNFGITAVEMLVTIILVAILAAIAFPSYQDLMQNYRAKSLSTEFNSALQFTRSEAIKRGQTITLCSTGNIHFTACGTVGDWRNGWIIFVDPNGDGVIANTQDRLQIHAALDPNSRFTTTTPRISFDGRGFSTTGATQVNISAPNCTGNHGRQFDISNTGRVAITQTAC